MNYDVIRAKDDMIMLGKFDCEYSFPLWLRKPKFDCGWYWGLGYLAGKGVHSHFDTVFPSYKGFVDGAIATPYTKDELWTICELMTQLYRLREYADMMHSNGAHISSTKGAIDLYLFAEDNKKEYRRICNILIPTVWNKLVNVMVHDDEKHNRTEERKKLYVAVKEDV
jgi:hypothetical protein